MDHSRALWVASFWLLSTVGFAADGFVPIPDADKPLYHFDFKKWFYLDEAARQRDFDELKRLQGQIQALMPRLGESSTALLNALDLIQQCGSIGDKLQAFGGLRLAVNTKDSVAQSEAREGEKARTDVEATINFAQAAVQKLTDEKLAQFMSQTPALAKYRFLFQEWRRKRPHTVNEDTEATLSSLVPHLDPFRDEFYTLMLDRSPNAIVTVSDQNLNVTNQGDFAQILRVDDRATREEGFRKRLATYKAQSDLFAYALFAKARSANAIADIHRFPNAEDSALFDFYLAPDTVDKVLNGFRENASLAIRFQKAERRYQEKILGLSKAEFWDVEARPTTLPEPRFTIDNAVRAVNAATSNLGGDYRNELENLLDPHNGRLDIVPGENRDSGDFTWGAYGPSWVFYMQGYRGYVTDVVTLAHESAHAVHYRLLYGAGVPWCYSDGARYFTEGFAKVNELLILAELAKTAKSDADKLFYSRHLCSKLASVKFASMYWAAYATSFEMEVYRRVKTGTIAQPEGIHNVWEEYGRTWMHGFDEFPDLKYTWPDTHHFFDTSRYYSNYLFAWVLALAVYEQLQDDPVAHEKFVRLMKQGFSDEPAVLLKTGMGIDLADPATLKRMFAIVEKTVADFESQVAAIK